MVSDFWKRCKRTKLEDERNAQHLEYEIRHAPRTSTRCTPPSAPSTVRTPPGKTPRTLTQQNSRSGHHLKRRKRPSKTRTSTARGPRTSRGPTCKTTRSRPKTRDVPEIQDTNRTARPCLQGERRETTSRLTSTPQQIHRRGTKPLIHDGGKKPLSDWKSSRHEPLHDTSSCHQPRGLKTNSQTCGSDCATSQYKGRCRNKSRRPS